MDQAAATTTEARPTAQGFRYETPEFEKTKASRSLGKTDIAFLKIQIFKAGGEVSLHSHTYQDGFWMVLSGRARFYTTDDVLVADLGPMEGVVVPRGFPYWFEKVGDEQMEILQFEASTKPVRTQQDFIDGRVDLTPRTHERGRADVADLSFPIP